VDRLRQQQCSHLPSARFGTLERILLSSGLSLRATRGWTKATTNGEGGLQLHDEGRGFNYMMKGGYNYMMKGGTTTA
jgi:hypothetical protein